MLRLNRPQHAHRRYIVATDLTCARVDGKLIALVRRALIILAALWFLALGTGAVEYAHNAQHARDDAKLAHADKSIPVHDDTNCPVHAQLHVPPVQPPVIALLVCLGLLVAFVTQLASPLVLVRVPARIDCRGPPVLV